MNLKQTGSGLIWTGVEKAFGQAIGFVQGVILARLLSPGDFGLAAMLGIFLAVGSALAESGLGNALIAFGGTRQAERRVLCWNVGIALLMYGVLALAAPWVAAFYAQPILKELLWVMAASLPLNAACVVGNARLNRSLRFAALSRMNIALSILSFALGVGLAYAGWGVWAIAWMNVGWAAARLLGVTLIAFRGEPVPTTGEAKPFAALLGYGMRLAACDLIAIVYNNCFALVIGKAFGAVSAGIYNRGLRWSQLAGEVVNASISRVSFAAFSRGEGGAVRYMLLNVALVWPCLLGLGVLATPIVRLVLGEAWLDCVPYLRILLLGAAVTPISTVSVNVLKANGRADEVLKSEAIKRPLAFAYLVAGVPFGVAGICWAKVANDVTEAVINGYLAARQRWWQHFLSYRDAIVDPELRHTLAAMHRKGELWRQLEGKSIAVVGNGPSEVGKGLGAEIDAHDVVIRINNYVTAGYEKDYGRRIDVWMKCGADDVRHEIRDASVKTIIYTDDILRMGMARGTVPYVRDEVKHLTVDYFSVWHYWRLALRVCALPTSGALLISRLRKVKGAQVDVYGFSFLQSTEEFVHYAQVASREEQARRLALAHHNIARESRYLARLFEGRRLFR